MNGKKAAMSVDIFNTTLTITFSDGRDIAIDASTLAPHIREQAMLHGLKQKLVDAAAIARNTETGLSASIDDKFSAVQEVAVRISRATNPTWNKEREGEKKETGNTLLVRALMQMTGKDRSYVDDFLTSKTKEQRAALKSNPRVVAIIAELQRAQSTVDTDELLGELGVETAEPAQDETVSVPKKPRAKKAVAIAE